VIEIIDNQPLVLFGLCFVGPQNAFVLTRHVKTKKMTFREIDTSWCIPSAVAVRASGSQENASRFSSQPFGFI